MTGRVYVYLLEGIAISKLEWFFWLGLLYFDIYKASYKPT